MNCVPTNCKAHYNCLLKEKNTDISNNFVKKKNSSIQLKKYSFIYEKEIFIDRITLTYHIQICFK